MDEILKQLGWTNDAINMLEIIITIFFILVGMIELIKYTKKAFSKVLPKVIKMKTLKKKLVALEMFYKWYVKSIKDGTISDIEIDDINQKLDDLSNNNVIKKDDNIDTKNQDANTTDNVNDEIIIK